MTVLTDLADNLKTAIETLAEFEGRLPAAEATLKAANEHRRSLVAQSVRGADDPKALKKAGLDIATAEDAIDILRAQIAEATAAVDRAQAEYDGAELTLAKEQLAQCKRAIIAAADKKQRAGVTYAEAEAEYQAAYDAIFPALQKAGIMAKQHEIDADRDRKTLVQAAIPAAVQEAIAKRGSAVVVDLSRRERNLWLDGATPDPEADEGPARAVREEAERINRQLAFDETGRKQNEHAAGSAPSWQPTELQPGIARRSIAITGQASRRPYSGV